MSRKVYIIVLCLIVLLFPACKKVTESQFPLLIVLESHLTDGPWRFISATTVYPNGTQSRYSGNVKDSVIFQNSASGNLALYPSTVLSFINGTNAVSKWSHPFGYTLTITPGWRSGLSDTVECTSISDYQMVFKIKSVNNSGNWYEIDTLSKIRFWNP